MISSKLLKQVLLVLGMSVFFTGIVLLCFFYFEFATLKVIMSLFLFFFGFIAVASADSFFKSIFLIVTAVVLLIFFDDFKEYALVVVLVLLSMFLGKVLYKHITEVFK